MTQYSLPNSIFNLAKTLNAVAVEPPNPRENQTILSMWKKQLGTNDEHLVTRFCFLLTLSNERVIELINESSLPDDSKKTYLSSTKSLNQISSVSNINLEWRHAKEKFLSQEKLAFLQGMRDALNGYYALEEIDQEIIDELMQQISSLKEIVEKDVADVLLKKYLMKEFELLEICVEKFSLVGGFGIEECTGKIIQKCITSRKKLPVNLRKRTIGTIFLIMKSLALFGGAAEGYEQLENGAEWALEEIEHLKEAEFPGTKLLEHKPSKDGGVAGLPQEELIDA